MLWSRNVYVIRFICRLSFYLFSNNGRKPSGVPPPRQVIKVHRFSAVLRHVNPARRVPVLRGVMTSLRTSQNSSECLQTPLPALWQNTSGQGEDPAEHGSFLTVRGWLRRRRLCIWRASAGGRSVWSGNITWESGFRVSALCVRRTARTVKSVKKQQRFRLTTMSSKFRHICGDYLSWEREQEVAKLVYFCLWWSYWYTKLAKQLAPTCWLNR